MNTLKTMHPQYSSNHRSLAAAALAAFAIVAILPVAHAADVTLTAGTYNDTQTYNNGTISGVVIFDSGANYTFDSLNLPLAWNRVTLNSGAALNVGGNLSVDVSGVSLNGGTLTTGGLLLHDSPNWNGSYNDGKQTLEYGDSIVNGATIVANQSNANFISLASSPGGYSWAVANNLRIGSDGATIDSSSHNIGITMSMYDYGGAGKLSKTGSGTLTLTTNNGYTGGTTVNQGTLEIVGSSTGNSYIRGTVTVNSGAELRFTGGDGTGFGFNGGNKLDTININGGLVNTQGIHAHVWGTAVNMTGGELRSNSGVSSPSGSQLEWNQSTVTTSPSASTATISGRINLRDDGGYSSAIFNVHNGSAITDLLVSAAITQNSAVGITKNGTGTMELTGTNSYTGATTVSAGTLLVNGNNAAATGAVSVASGATLGGTGTLGGAVSVTGIIAPGNSIGTLNTGTTTWLGAASGSAATDWQFELGAGNSSDKLAINGDFLRDASLGTTFRFDFMDSNFTGTFRLITWTGASSAGWSLGDFSYDPASLGGGRTGVFTFNTTDKYLDFTVIPEISNILIIGLLGSGMWRRRRL